jgi:N-acylglucosamine-6-phosphate 2-epimerase
MVSVGEPLLERLRSGLVVSCQAPASDALSGPEIMAAMAKSVVAAGAVGVRIEGVDDIAAVRSAVDVPIVGLVKVGRSGVYITPTVEDALSVARAGADIVAIDGTDRPRPDGRTLQEVVDAIHKRAGCLVLADVSTLDEARLAEAASADIIATTLAGHVDSSDLDGLPDIDLVGAVVTSCRVPVIAEGRIATPVDARRALDAGAWCVVVGTSITRPAVLTERFVAALDDGR